MFSYLIAMSLTTINFDIYPATPASGSYFDTQLAKYLEPKKNGPVGYKIHNAIAADKKNRR